MDLQPFVGTWAFFSLLILYKVGMTAWKGNQSSARSLPTHGTTQTE
jgi:hypothetical protein